MRPPLRRTASIALVALCIAGASCSSSSKVTSVRSDNATPGSGATSTGDDAFAWQDSQDNAVQTGSLHVPIDYDDPSKGTFDLYVARHKASNSSERIGTLLVNPGGPGFAGSDLAISAENVYSQYLLDHFDIVAWDPRGTGLTTPAIDCVTDYDHYFDNADITPDDAAERQQIIDLAKEFEDACVTKNAKILQYIGTNNSARDIDSIRRALGEEKITYFGFSYGSELGATWVTLFPDTVRAAVLDGASDPTVSLLDQGLAQAKGFEDSVATFLQACDDDDDCPFRNGGNAEDAFDTLMASIDESPLQTVSGRPPLTRQAALTGVTDAMYSQFLWPQLAQALADAQHGDGAGLLALYDSYYQRGEDGSYPNYLEAFQTITCMDRVERLTVAEDDASVAQYQQVAPRFSPGTTGGYFCTYFPPSEDPRVKITGTGAGPVLVVGTTGDPATPLASSKNMAAALEDGVLLTVVGEQHTGYTANECAQTTIDDYLVELQVPKVGTRCS